MTSMPESPDDPRFICTTCKGPIFYGEPIIWDSGGAISHRFSTWCKFYQDQDADFRSACGIKES
jgi:hypothetical protein